VLVLVLVLVMVLVMVMVMVMVLVLVDAGWCGYLVVVGMLMVEWRWQWWWPFVWTGQRDPFVAPPLTSAEDRPVRAVLLLCGVVRTDLCVLCCCSVGVDHFKVPRFVRCRARAGNSNGRTHFTNMARGATIMPDIAVMMAGYAQSYMPSQWRAMKISLTLSETRSTLAACGKCGPRSFVGTPGAHKVHDSWRNCCSIGPPS
jgi:hypothetical protein